MTQNCLALDKFLDGFMPLNHCLLRLMQPCMSFSMQFSSAVLYSGPCNDNLDSYITPPTPSILLHGLKWIMNIVLELELKILGIVEGNVQWTS